MVQDSVEVVGRTGQSLPQDIWWLVAQELARQGDFETLFLCARLSKGIAALALPELYAIHHQSPAINAHILQIEKPVRLWRSIITSSLGKTLFPYCCWIKALKLGSLHANLEDLSRGNPGLKALFFSKPLERLLIRRGKGRVLDLDAIIVEVANMVTGYIRASAEQEAKRVGITSLEGLYLPTACLPRWISSLSLLTSLRVRDGSVLTSDVSRAIREHCPAFKEVECFFCIATDVDEELAGFIRGLEPNTLESFTVLSMNEIGGETFKALCGHAASLKTLVLYSLQQSAFQSLNELRHCLAVEALQLEAASTVQNYPWDKQTYAEVVQWLQNCASLKKLEFANIPTSTKVLADVLESPSVRLTSLELKKLNAFDELHRALSKQKQLQHLLIQFTNDDLLDVLGEYRANLADAIASLHQLRKLVTNIPFNAEELRCLSSTLRWLEELVLDGEIMDDDTFLHLSQLSKLRTLNILGPSLISPRVAMDFVEKMGQDEEGEHEGLHVYVSNQLWDSKFTGLEEAKVATAFWDRFRGRFEINYRADPDELHESDFSD
ncbi:hypothetical protein VTI74DRAFT_5343 [Chaetomium olivicolor]